SGFYFGTPTADDFSKVENSSAKEKKEFIGKIYHYYKRINVGLIKLNSGKLKIGDDIYIIGKQTGVLRTKISSMQIEHNNVVEVKKNDCAGIKLPNCRRGDEIYLIKN
ncbi:MAG: U32 family peptidase, partial [archaeon]